MLQQNRSFRFISACLGLGLFLSIANMQARAVALLRGDDMRQDLLTVQLPANSSPAAPTDDDIITLAKNEIKRGAMDRLNQSYGNLDKVSTDPLSQLTNLGPATTGPIMDCALNAPEQKAACINRVKAELLAERAKRAKDIQNFDVGSVFSFDVQSKANYEGNYVVYLHARKLGTDTNLQYKILLQPKNGAWVVEDLQEKVIE